MRFLRPFRHCWLPCLSVFALCSVFAVSTTWAVPVGATPEELAARDALGERLPGARLLWVRNGKILYSPIQNFQEQQVTGSATEDRPRWSPDGSTILFQRKNGKYSDVYTMKSDFSGEKKILSNAHSADWAEDGSSVTAILYNLPDTIQEGDKVVKCVLGSGLTEVIHDVSASGFNGWPLSQTAELHPQGRYLLTFSTMDGHHSYIVDIQDKRYLYNTEMWRGDCGPGWAPDGSYFTTTARTTSRPALKTVFTWGTSSLPASTHFLGLNTSDQYYHHGHRISNDGEWAVGGILWNAGPMKGNREIYIWEIDDPDRDDHAVRLTFDDLVDESPSIYIGSAPTSDPAIALSPTQVSFEATQGGNDPDSVTVAVSNIGGGILGTVEVSKKASWLTVSARGSGNAQKLDNNVSITGLNGGTYRDTVEVQVGNATNSPRTYVVTLSVVSMRAPDNPDGLLAGLNAYYYELSSPSSVPDFNQFDHYLLDSVDNLDFASTSAAFATSGRADNVGAVFSGYVWANRDDMYTFYVESDNGAVLYIGDAKVVDNDGSHGMQESSGTIGLKEGKHRFRLEYYEADQNAGLIVQWDRPGTVKHVIPAGSFFRDPPNVIRFTVLSPVEGDVWQVGTTQLIKWTAENAEEAIIEFSMDNGLSYLDDVWLVQKGTEHWGEYPWIVPDSPSVECRIRIGEYEGQGADVSGQFEITRDASALSAFSEQEGSFVVRTLGSGRSQYVALDLGPHKVHAVEAVVYDLRGNAVARLGVGDNGRSVWDVRSMGRGLFVLRVYDGDRNYAKRIIVR